MAIRWDDLDGQDGELDMFAAWMAGYDPGPTLAERLAAWRPPWHAQAACRARARPGLSWFDPDGTAAATEVCSSCPVRDRCEQAGRREPLGVWGGRGAGRRRLRRLRHRREAVRPGDVHPLLLAGAAGAAEGRLITD